MQLSQAECILTVILNCGYADLRILEDIEYDLDDIIKELVDNNELSFNNILRNVFMQGVSELEECLCTNKEEILKKIEDSIVEIEKEIIVYDDTSFNDYREKYQNLIKYKYMLKNDELKPTEQWDCCTNYLDTTVYLKHLDFYLTLLETELNNIENMIGFKFENMSYE